MGWHLGFRFDRMNTATYVGEVIKAPQLPSLFAVTNFKCFYLLFLLIFLLLFRDYQQQHRHIPLLSLMPTRVPAFYLSSLLRPAASFATISPSISLQNLSYSAAAVVIFRHSRLIPLYRVGHWPSGGGVSFSASGINGLFFVKFNCFW